MTTDIIGRELDATETELLQTYRRLRELVAREDLPPCVAANLKHALAYCWNAVNDLGLEYEHLLDVGV